MTVIDKTYVRQQFAHNFSALLDAIPNYPKHGDGRQTKLEKDFKTSQGGITKWFNAGATPAMPLLLKICDEFNASIDYLFTGKGDMFRSDNQNRVHAVPDFAFLTDVMIMIDKILAEDDSICPPESKARVIVQVYKLCQRSKKVNIALVKSFLTVAMSEQVE